MIPKPIEQVTRDDIIRLIDNGVSEGRTIEYKREVPGASDGDKVKFLKAVSGMANTDGGDLIYGIDAKDGIPLAAPGFSMSQADQVKLRMEGILQTSVEPRVPSVVLHTVPMDAESCVLVVRTRRSWLAPHRISVGNHVQFYGRNSASTYPMDVTQLREAFLVSDQHADRVRGFVVDRLLRIEQGRAPVTLEPGAKMVLHVLPIASLSPRAQHQLEVPKLERTSFPIFGDGSRSSKANLEGFVVCDTRRGDCQCYTQVFRSGAAETVAVFGQFTTGEHALAGGRIEYLVNQLLPNLVRQLHGRGVPGPYVVSLSFVDVAGCEMQTNTSFSHREKYRYPETMMTLPDVLLETPEAFQSWTIMRPIFDVMWNAFEYDGSPNYDSDGNWHVR
ncbi:hypothetical protein ASD28_22925 [Massilia sp. Root133]|uniref:AlbA family DNA-binding domain-containing protein n=1 Tax=unclassified Massilia TaxID=2609279 RepID=UPI0006FC56C1|nr:MULTISPECIES: ATP-binding protein [unclassified Massilia]KQY15722.1 hypothetical protein ASD28_22925 [Massilia sp. Root133]KQZ44452.1 hypothetical protein ASD92_28290 [Massilia sp. Root1485]